MPTYYRTSMYKHNPHGCRWSIDQCHDDGHYICQVAFWFPSRAAASARLAGILAEDAAAGQDSLEWRPE